MSDTVSPAGELLLRTHDLPVSPAQFAGLPIFSTLSSKPNITMSQQAFVLRVFTEPGEIICRQNVEGVTAYFILNDADVYGLYAQVEKKLGEAEDALTKKVDNPAKLKRWVEHLRETRDAYRCNVEFLTNPGRTALLQRAYQADLALAKRWQSASRSSSASPSPPPDPGEDPTRDLHWYLTSARAADKRVEAERVRPSDPELAQLLEDSARAHDDRPAAMAVRRTAGGTPQPAYLRDRKASDGLVSMIERQIFGEMACRNRKPRAATVQTVRPCYVIEMLSHVLDALEKDDRFRKRLEALYQERILELHLRDFSLFRHLPEHRFADLFGRIRDNIGVLAKKAGEEICKEGDDSDAVYLIRQGRVQVKIRRDKIEYVIAYRGPGEFIGEMGLIRTREQTIALRRGDFTGELRTMPKPDKRTATCVAFSHPDGTGKIELVKIPYSEFWQLIQESPGTQQEIADEAERRWRRLGPTLAPDVAGNVEPLFADGVMPLGLYQGRSLMLIDLERCTRCDECVRGCVESHTDGRSRLFLLGPRTEIDARRYLVPTTCQACDDPVCMIRCPTRAIQRGERGEMTIDERTCIGCSKCADDCPYDAIQMHDIGLISALGGVDPRARAVEKKLLPDNANDEEDAVPVQGWYCYPAKNIAAKELLSWHKRTTPPRGWLECTFPFRFTDDFRAALAASAGRSTDDPIASVEAICFWRTLQMPSSLANWDGEVVLKAEPKEFQKWLDKERDEGPEAFQVWIDGNKVACKSTKRASKGELPRLAPLSARGWRWWRKPEVHVMAVQVIPNWPKEVPFLNLRLDPVRPMPAAWDTAEQVGAEKRQPRLAVVCDLCHTRPSGPECVLACPHNATLRFDARGGVPAW